MGKRSDPKHTDDAMVPAPSAALDYKLVVSEQIESTLYRRARLISPMLDPVMHGKEPLLVAFESFWARTAELKEGQFVLEAFHLSSLEQYLTTQSVIRPALEAAVNEHLAEWDKEKTIGRDGEMWKKISIGSVQFRFRHLPQTREQVRKTTEELLGKRTEKQVDDDYAYQLRTCDRPETRGSFTVDFDGLGMGGHECLARVRDGEVVEFRVEG